MRGKVNKNNRGVCVRDLRSTLHFQRANIVHATFHDVLTGGGELHALALEILLIVNCELQAFTETTCSVEITFVCQDVFISVVIKHLLAFHGPIGMGLVRAILEDISILIDLKNTGFIISFMTIVQRPEAVVSAAKCHCCCSKLTKANKSSTLKTDLGNPTNTTVIHLVNGNK